MKRVVFILLLVALIFSCDLFNASLDPDYWEKIDAEIAWANAARLTVTVAVPQEWGTSPQNGTDRSFDAVRTTETPRLGYAFNVEFTPSSGYGFVEWLAFKSDEYPVNIDTMDFDTAKDLSFDEEDAIITPGAQTHTGAFTATVTVNIEDDITLIPFCDQRPRVIQSNPPLINTGRGLSRSQRITIYFSNQLDYQNNAVIPFNIDNIWITGQYMDDEGGFYGTDSDGNITECFNTPTYNSSLRTITIIPRELPDRELSITVTVGTGITAGGIGMAAPVSFSYLTTTEDVKDRYIAENIWAIHKPDTPEVTEENFFYPNAIIDVDTKNYRDPRLRKNDSGNYEVTLYFSVVKTNAEEMEDPTHCVVQEYRAFNLSGNNTANITAPKIYEISPINPAQDEAGSVYRSANNGVITYKITHELQASLNLPGIWRLILLPYYEVESEEEETVIIGQDIWQTANTEGYYASVVLDNLPPSGTISLAMSGGQVSGTGVYSYGQGSSVMSFEINFNNLADNGISGGITWDNALPDKPWTMDRFEDLEWQWRIVCEDGEQVYPDKDDIIPWYSMDKDKIEDIDLADVLGSSTETRRIQLRYRDNLDNETVGWSETNTRLTYYAPYYGEITGWSAVYNPDDDEIVVNWTNPSEDDFVRVEVWYIENGNERRRNDLANKANTFTITDVPRLNTNGVREGISVYNTYRYEIYLRAHSELDYKPPVSFKIWNFGTPTVPATSTTPAVPGSGMRVGTAAGFTEAIEITSVTGDTDDTDGTISLANLALGDVNKQYVLARDLTVTDAWMPIGYGTAAATAFRGKFYGNGYTVTIGSMNAATYTYIGLFGVIDDGTVRDLTVLYEADGNVVSIPGYGTRFGGIAGAVQGNAHLENILVKGAVSRDGATSIVGGLIGEMSDTANIFNAYGGLNISVTNTTNLGGIVGYMQNGAIDEVSVVGDIAVTGVTTSNIRVGGLVGDMSGGSLTNSEYHSGIISVTIMSGSNQLIGGAVGRTLNNSTIIYCSAIPAEFYIIKKYGGGALVVGGFIGSSAISDSGILKYCYSDSSIVINIEPDEVSNRVYAGGFAGDINGEISYCYAKGNVSAISYGGTSSLGGFTGSTGNTGSNSTARTTEVKYCYALGNVSFIQKRLVTSNVTAWTGGFIGVSGSNTNVKIEDCYALGDVFIDSVTNRDVYAGGIVGWSGGNTIVNRSFSTGKVTAQQGTSSRAIFAGGLAGDIDSFTITNSAALGASVTGTGGITKNIGRVFGSTDTANKSNNFAFNGMRLYWSNTYGDSDPLLRSQALSTPNAAAQPIVSDSGGKDGEDAHLGIFKDRRFWTGEVPAVITNNVYTSGGLGFSEEDWDLSTVEERGHPVLRASPGGPRMGGQ